MNIPTINEPLYIPSKTEVIEEMFNLIFNFFIYIIFLI